MNKVLRIGFLNKKFYKKFNNLINEIIISNQELLEKNNYNLFYYYITQHFIKYRIKYEKIIMSLIKKYNIGLKIKINPLDKDIVNNYMNKYFSLEYSKMYFPENEFILQPINKTIVLKEYFLEKYLKNNYNYIKNNNIKNNFIRIHVNKELPLIFSNNLLIYFAQHEKLNILKNSGIFAIKFYGNLFDDKLQNISYSISINLLTFLFNKIYEYINKNTNFYSVGNSILINNKLINNEIYYIKPILPLSNICKNILYNGCIKLYKPIKIKIIKIIYVINNLTNKYNLYTKIFLKKLL